MDNWVSAWGTCTACGHQCAVVRPLVMDVAAGQCPQCAVFALMDNGPRWIGPNRSTAGERYEAALIDKYGPKCCAP